MHFCGDHPSVSSVLHREGAGTCDESGVVICPQAVPPTGVRGTDNMSLGVVKDIWINAESTAGGLAKARYSPLQAGHQPKPREVLAAGLTLKDEHVFC